jgi:hypothetical protein
MEATPKERDVIVERLAAIHADPNEHPAKPGQAQAPAGEKIDRETTKLLRKLADDKPAP